jgi:hypothetical protein
MVAFLALTEILFSSPCHRTLSFTVIGKSDSHLMTIAAPFSGYLLKITLPLPVPRAPRAYRGVRTGVIYLVNTTASSHRQPAQARRRYSALHSTFLIASKA